MMRELARAIYHSLRSVPALGLLGAIVLFCARFTKCRWSITPRGYSHPLAIRGRTSDSFVFYTIFCAKEYPHLSDSGIKTILDAGANAGYSSVYFAHCYPDARIIAVEPEESNYEVLKDNVRYYENIRACKAALWSVHQTLHLRNPGSEKWEFYVSDRSDPKAMGYEVESCTVVDVIEKEQWNTIDLIKLDIEGAERRLFKEHTEWLGRVHYIMMEIHGDSWKTVFDTLSRYDYTCSLSGENLILHLK